jgi:hypothetical protein
VIPHATIRIPVETIEHVDHGTDGNVQIGFLTHFPRDGGLERFTELDGSARQAPFAFERLVTALHEKHAITIEHHGADANYRTIGMSPHGWLGVRLKPDAT